MFVSFTNDNTSGTSRLWLARTDAEGLIEQSTFYGNTNEAFWPQTLLPHREGFVAVSSYVNQDSVEISGSIALIRWDSNMQPEWMRLYGTLERAEYAIDAIVCQDSGFLLFGQSVNVPETEADLYAVRTDSLGIQLWERRYGGGTYDACASAVETPDGGFLLLGWTRSYGAGQRDFYLVKTDSLGEQEWQQTYGDEGFDSGSGIISLSDGNYLLAGYRNLSERRQGYLYKIDPTGTVIWENEYGDSNTTEEFNKVIELPNGDIVAAGLYDPYGASVEQSDNGGLLVKVDSEGNELLRRVYQKNEDTDLFYSVLLAEDGGFLLSGQARDSLGLSQDAWLLKVDSMGCAFPNCPAWVGVGVDEVEESETMVTVFPNPFSNNFNLSYSLPSEAQNLQVEVFDLIGRSVKTVQLENVQNGQMTIELGECLGIYILRMTADGKQVHQQKMVCLSR
jgi:hypothetical protein